MRRSSLAFALALALVGTTTSAAYATAEHNCQGVTMSEGPGTKDDLMRSQAHQRMAQVIARDGANCGDNGGD